MNDARGGATPTHAGRGNGSSQTVDLEQQVEPPGAAPATADDQIPTPDGVVLEQLVAAYERSVILVALASTRGNLARTAEALGIGPSTLYRKLRRYGIDTPGHYGGVSGH